MNGKIRGCTLENNLAAKYRGIKFQLIDALKNNFDLQKSAFIYKK